jgi:hypothetical protein
MKLQLSAALLAASLLGWAAPTFGQAVRQDAFWARSTNGAPITLNGILNEPAWASAESMIVRYRVDSGIPGSGWKEEGGVLASDSTYATLKLLTVGNVMYLGAVVRDKSIGGSADFNRFDGFLMAIKDHASTSRPAPPAEYFYSWWYPTDPNPTAIGKMPAFAGKWATWPPGTPRDSTQIANWDAVTVVNGQTNTDATQDVSYTVEMKFNLTPMGYDVTKPGGDVVEWNISIYDCDWYWPLDVARFSSNRTWWQGPWGNAAWYDEVHVFARSDVTISSGPVPFIQPEMRVANGLTLASPVIDGSLSDAVWSKVTGFDIRYGDDPLRLTYPGVGPWRAGQYQPPVNGGMAYVADPGNATVKIFFKADTLFLGFDVRDQVVQYHSSFDRWDGFLVSVNDRATRGPDNNLIGRRLTFQVGPDGKALAQDWLPFLRDSLQGARVAIQLKPGTTLDTLGQTADTGYTAELAITLTKIGYPAGRGDGSLFLGITLLDGDSFTPFTDSYGTRTWWFREYENDCCPVWAYMDPNLYLTGVDEHGPPVAERFTLLGSAPNPAKPNHGATIRYAMAEAGDVTLEIYDLQGRLMAAQHLGVQQPGERQAVVRGAQYGSGVHAYRVRIADPATGATKATLSGKMMFLR